MLGTSVSHLRQLTNQGAVTATLTPGGHRRYDPATLRHEWQAHTKKTPPLWHQTYPLTGLAETDDTVVWKEVKQTLPPWTSESARSILGYAVTEMTNNAIDHSYGSRLVASVQLDGTDITVALADDGVGAFASMAKTFGLPDDAAAAVEITKGKRTTAPDRHSGEGIFFTSKAVDVFDLRSNGYRVVFDNRVADVALGETDGTGTTVILKLSLITSRQLIDVFRAYTDDEGRFNRTTPRIELITTGGEFLSRGEARRFADGLEEFDRVILDFTGVTMIGQGFADELFRVWHRAHPSVVLQVQGADPAVALMINRV